MSNVFKAALALTAAVALVAATGIASTDAACTKCRPASKTIYKTKYKYTTVRQVRNLTKYKDVYRVHYFVKKTKVVTRAEYERFKRSCKDACVLAK